MPKRKVENDDSEEGESEEDEDFEPDDAALPSAYLLNGAVNLRRVCVHPSSSGATSSKAGAPVIYWMSRDQRAKDNWALIHAAEEAKRNGAPLAVAFNLGALGISVVLVHASVHACFATPGRCPS